MEPRKGLQEAVSEDTATRLLGRLSLPGSILDLHLAFFPEMLRGGGGEGNGDTYDLRYCQTDIELLCARPLTCALSVLVE